MKSTSIDGLDYPISAPGYTRISTELEKTKSCEYVAT